jgi:hypothetical protein
MVRAVFSRGEGGERTPRSGHCGVADLYEAGSRGPGKENEGKEDQSLGGARVTLIHFLDFAQNLLKTRLEGPLKKSDFLRGLDIKNLPTQKVLKRCRSILFTARATVFNL